MIIPIKVKKVPKREFHPFVPPQGWQPDREVEEGKVKFIFNADISEILVDGKDWIDGDWVLEGEFTCRGVEYIGMVINAENPHDACYVRGEVPDLTFVPAIENGRFVQPQYRELVFDDSNLDDNTVADDFCDWLYRSGVAEVVPEPESVYAISLERELSFTGMSDKTWELTIGQLINSI